MPEDRKPDQRFAMIGLEIVQEDLRSALMRYPTEVNHNLGKTYEECPKPAPAPSPPRSAAFWISPLSQVYEDQITDTFGITEIIRTTLRLIDFDEFRVTARRRNVDAGRVGLDQIDRRTRRTTRAIVYAIAEYIIRESSTVWVIAQTSACEKMLCEDIVDRARVFYQNVRPRMRIDATFPNRVYPAPDGALARRGGAVPRGVVVLRDHSSWPTLELQGVIYKP